FASKSLWPAAHSFRYCAPAHILPNADERAHIGRDLFVAFLTRIHRKLEVAGQTPVSLGRVSISPDKTTKKPRAGINRLSATCESHAFIERIFTSGYVERMLPW